MMRAPRGVPQPSPAQAAQGDALARRTLHVSIKTRVFRLGTGTGAQGVICKEHLGPSGSRRLSHETSVLRRLRGIPGVVRLAEGSAPAGLLALQDCGGVSLYEILRRGPIGLPAALSFARQLAWILADVHRAGVIHRDINPSNILMTPDGTPVLIDFESALVLEDHETPASSQGIEGTLAYLAPEQTGRTSRAVDQRSDLYALGATLYELATGHPPFEEQDALQLVHDHLVREPVAPLRRNPAMPPAVSGLILRLLSKEPEDRYQSADGVAYDLERLNEDLAAGRQAHFGLGTRDFPARLPPPPRLIGRAAAIEALQLAFATARRTGHALLLDGAPGVGKSALIHELKPLLAVEGGRFIAGKFDQYHRAAAAESALTQTLRALGRLLLAEEESVLESNRRRLAGVLGRNAALITEAVPEFKVLLGEQPAPADVDPALAEQRLIQTTVDLLRAFASPGQPMALVLDDLQWASGLALRFFDRLMSEIPPGLLLVGAYRAADADATELLGPMVQRWTRHEPAPACIALENLPRVELAQMLEAMLRLPAQDAGELAEAIDPLTGGNPFDTVETVNALRREGVLRLGADGWQWDDAAIGRFVHRGSVVDLLAERIARLPAAARELLQFAACLGDSVDHELLQAASGLDGATLEERLRTSLADGLVVAERETGKVRFRHDRVQQAVLAGLGEDGRSRLQLEMARRLAGHAAFGKHAAQQYLGCIPLLQDPGEKRAAADMFAQAGQHLSGAAAFALAERYLAAAGMLLDALAGQETGNPVPVSSRLAIDAARHVALYSLGRLDEADGLYARLSEATGDPLALVPSTCLQIRSLDIRGQMKASLVLGRAVLARLGIRMPAAGDRIAARDGLGDLRAWATGERRRDPAGRALLTDPRLRAAARVMCRMVRSAFYIPDFDTLSWLTLECKRLWMEHGPSPELVLGLCRAGNLLISLAEDYGGAYDVMSLVVDVGEKLGFEPETSEVRHVFGSYARPWHEPLDSCVNVLARSCEGLQAHGNVSQSCYPLCTLIEMQVDCVRSLDICESEIGNGLALCERTGNFMPSGLILIERQFVRALRGSTRAPGSMEDEHFEQAGFLQTFASLSFTSPIFHMRAALAAALFRDLGALVPHARHALSMLDQVPGHYLTAHVRLLQALALAWQLQAPGRASESSRTVEELAAHRRWFGERAADNPHSFLHLLHLVEAEEAWASGDPWKAYTAFDAAVSQARAHAGPWQGALICERAARFCLSHQLPESGRRLMGDACDQFESWGAAGKVRELLREHDWLQARPRPGPKLSATLPFLSTQPLSGQVTSETLDLMGVLRASQALSSETSLDRLTIRVCETLAAMTGATSVSVLSWQEGLWWVLARTPGEPAVKLADAVRRKLLPVSAFDYAQRTGEPLVVDDALADDRFAHDPYFAGRSHCSLLLAPISGQGQARAMLLLENRNARAAFSARRLDAVKLVAGQLSVSLANVQLYESLEQRVELRTRELRDTQAKLVDTARRAGKAEIANNVLHNVGNVLNSVNVSATLATRTIGQSKSRRLGDAMALLNRHVGRLDEFIANDPKGRQLLGYMTRLAAVLSAEQQEVVRELDRLNKSVDHIREIVTTQQTHAGASSVLQLARPHELLEEALHVSAERVTRHKVAVVRDYAAQDAIPLDKPRLLQVLVNLIGNATDAMEHLPQEARRLTLAARVVVEGGARRLRIMVRDEGEGIAPEDLTRIFSHGFTTKPDGHGFGLHSSALAAVEMGGILTAHSDGPGTGALFQIELPVTQKETRS